MIAAHADWHAIGVAESALNLDDRGLEHEHDDGHSHDHSHDEPVLQVFIDHLVNDPVALATKGAEAVAAVCFAALAIGERRR